MFLPEVLAESSCLTGCFVGLAVHRAVDEVLVFHDYGEFAVTVA